MDSTSSNRPVKFPFLFRSTGTSSVAAAFLLIFLSFLALTHQAHAIVDSNQNNVSDLWEKKYNNGSLFPTFDPLSDADGDGWTAAQEAIAGTNPFSNTTPTGYLRPEFSHIPATPTSPATLSTTWTTLPWKQYTLQASSDLTSGSWLTIGMPEIGRGHTITQNVAATVPGGTAAPCCFLRVAVADLDRDSDTLTDAEEAELGSDPYSSDGDNDGLSDVAELFTYHTHPRKHDTDSDGVSDGNEILVNFTNPLTATDADGDGIPDDFEKHLAKQLLAYKPSPSDWGTYYAGLLAGNLDATHDYTGDGMNASELAQVIKKPPATGPANSGYRVEQQGRSNSIVAYYFMSTSNTSSGTYFHSVPNNYDVAENMTPTANLSSQYLLSRIDGASWWEGYMTSGDQISIRDGWGESAFQSSPFVSPDGGGFRFLGRIIQQRCRLIATDPGHEAYSKNYIKITQDSHYFSWNHNDVIAVEPLTVQLPRGRLISDWYVFKAPIIDESGGRSAETRLLPVEVISDLNNDGQITAADNPLRDAAAASGATDEIKDKGTEFIFHNDNLSNGIWDKEDTDPARPAAEKDDDDAEEITIKPGITEGEVWLDHPAIAGLSFYKTRECNAGDKVNLSPTSKFTVSASNPFPGKLYMRADGTLTYPPANPQFEGDLVLKIKVGTNGQEIEAVKMKLTVVKDFGAKKYFHAANDYVLENNTELFVHEKSYDSVFFRLCLMREEGTDVLPLELYEPAKDNWIQAGSIGNFSAYTYREAAGISEVMMNSPNMTVVINGNQCGFTSGLTSVEAAAMSALGDPQITDKCQGRLKELSASQSSVSNDHFDENTNIPGTQMKGSALAGPDPLPGTSPPQPGGKYIAQYPDGKIVVGLNFAPDFSAPPNPSYMLTQMGGLSSSYSSSDRNNFNNSLVGTAPIGSTNKKMVFVIMGRDGNVGKGKTVELYNSAVSSGVPQISGATTPSGSSPPITMVFLDSGVTSCALAYKKPSGTLDLLYKGSKHNGSPYYTNTFLQFKSSKPRP
jgi:hypothetical protein